MALSTVTINVAALRHNLSVVRAAAPDRKVMAVIKANAYGHGMLDCAKALASAEGFAVARMEEALLLRQRFPEHVILLMNPDGSDGCWQRAASARLHVVIHSRQDADSLATTTLSQPIGVWLKIDSGMHRLGIGPEEVRETFNLLQEARSVADITLMTHLASADEPNNPFTAQQLETFHRAIHGLKADTSIANSAGVLAWPDTHGSWVRPGIMLYGYDPLERPNNWSRQLQPVMSLHSKLLSVREIATGERVGYNGTWKADRPSRIGTIAIGYGDGYPRSAEPGTPVLVASQEVPLVGRVSMDLITVDLTDYPDIQPGAAVELWGAALHINRVARCAGTISYELTTRLTARPVRSLRDKA